MSGSNRLINSENTANGNSQEELKTKLAEANEEAIKATEAGIPTKEN